ncbi:MAG: hypothetical protein ACOX19_03105 [Fermentimonas sp.]|jgi:hypothetical protein
MCFPNGLKRLKQSRGHAVHSPFAYELITQVFRSPYNFYAFYDIPERLRDHGIDPRIITPFNHLSFRLVQHLKAWNILEVSPGTGINTLFLMAASTRVSCTWVKENGNDETERSIVSLLPRRPRRVVALPALQEERLVPEKDQFVPEEELLEPGKEAIVLGEGLFDAIFVNCSNAHLPPIDQLLKLGRERAFWVIHSIADELGTRYWKQIVHDKRINVTFEGKETGVVFPWNTLTPSHYFF